MRFYLSSFKLGEHFDSLLTLYGSQRPLGYVANALDHLNGGAWIDEWVTADISQLTEIGFDVRPFDLRDYFAGDSEIGPAASALSGVWISGGNVFVLRQAMRLSGFDAFVIGDQSPNAFVYGGYSAACCVLSPSLAPYALVDDPSQRPYEQITETIWDGLGILDFAFMPHYKSQHSESELIDKEIDYCRENAMPYRAFRDGEVLII